MSGNKNGDELSVADGDEPSIDLAISDRQRAVGMKPPSRIVSPPPPPHLKAHELPDDFNEVKSEPFKNSLRSLKQQRDEQEKLVEDHASLIAELDETLATNRKEHRDLLADLGRMTAALRAMVEGRDVDDQP